jgi:hypothetical protein
LLYFSRKRQHTRGRAIVRQTHTAAAAEGTRGLGLLGGASSVANRTHAGQQESQRKPSHTLEQRTHARPLECRRFRQVGPRPAAVFAGDRVAVQALAEGGLQGGHLVDHCARSLLGLAQPMHAAAPTITRPPREALIKEQPAAQTHQTTSNFRTARAGWAMTQGGVG